MKRKTLVFLGILATIFAVYMMIIFPRAITPETKAPSPVHETAKDSSPILVTSTIYPLTCIVEGIGGSNVETATLLPPGGSAHLHEATPDAIKKAQKSDLLLHIGGGLDEWANDIFEMSQGVRSLEIMSAVQDMHDDQNGLSNPHVWTDPVIVKDLLVPLLEKELSRIDEANTDKYAKRAESFRGDLAELDNMISDMFSSVSGSSFIGDHPAWTKFAERYGLHEQGVIEKSPGYECSPSEMSTLIDEAEKYETNVIVTTRGHGAMLAESLADRMEDVIILELDPIGDPDDSTRDSYIDLIHYNAVRLLEALSEKETRPVE